MSAQDTNNYYEEWIPVADLEIDPRVQRFGFNPKKVELFYRNYNPNALGIITVSQRNPVTKVIVDGWHRWELVRRITDNAGKIYSRIFTDLTLASEAQMFLDLNPGNQPNALDRFRVKLLLGKGTEQFEIDKITKHYGWAVQASQGNGTLQCVQALERIYRKSQANEATEDTLPLTMLVITRAWGSERAAGVASILEGIAAVITEYRGSNIDLDRLSQQLKEYPGGPASLLDNAQQQARVRRMRTPMSVASLIVDEYNRGLRLGGPNSLPAWRGR